MSKIDKEISELAEKMVKSTTSSKDLLIDTVMELGPEGLKKALPALNDSQKGILKDFLDDLTKAVSMDDQYTPKKTETKAEDMKTESQTGSDDEDEDLVKPKAAEHKHQGDDSPEGKEGQVIKAAPGAGVGSIVKGDKKEMKEIAEKEAKEEVEDHNKKLHSKDMKKSEEPQMGIEEMLKSMSDEDMSKIDKEISELAEKMVKSTTSSKDLLIDTVMELGPEGLKKALPALNDSQKGILKDFLDDLTKAVSMDDQYTPKKTETKAEDMKTESQTGSDDEDEDLVKPKAAEHKHQGDDSPEGKEGQVIKAAPGAGVGSIVKGDKKEMKEIAEKEAKEEVEDHNKKLHSKDMKKSEEPQMGIEEMLKSMSDEDMSKMMYKMCNERGMEKSDIYKILMGKGCEQSSLDKCWEGMGSMKKSEEAPVEDETVEKGKMKMLAEEEQSKTKMQDESKKEKIPEEDGDLKEDRRDC